MISSVILYVTALDVNVSSQYNFSADVEDLIRNLLQRDPGAVVYYHWHEAILNSTLCLSSPHDREAAVLPLRPA